MFSHRLPVESPSSPEEPTTVIIYFVSRSFKARSFLTHLIFYLVNKALDSKKRSAAAHLKTKQEQHISHMGAIF